MNARPLAFRGEFSAPTHAAATAPFARVGPVIAQLCRKLLDRQRGDGSWCDPQPADTAAAADLLLLFAFLGRDSDPRRLLLAQTLADQQHEDGSWGTLNATVRTYLALKLIVPHIAAIERARGWLAGLGSAACDEASRFRLALFGQLPHAEHRSHLSARSTSELLALQILDVYKPVMNSPKDPVLAHLFRDEFRFPVGRTWNPLRLWQARRSGQQLQQVLTNADPADGAPTTVFPLLALRTLGLPESDPGVLSGWRQIEDRLIDDGETLHVAPRLAPLQDTALALIALREAGMAAGTVPVAAASEWLWNRLVRGQARGDLAIDDAALALLALARSGFAFQGDRPTLLEHVLHAILDQQRDDGGWDVPERTGLVLEVLGQFGVPIAEPVVTDALAYLECAQEPDSGWGTIRATWRVLAGLRAVQHDAHSLMVRRAVSWLKRTQQVGGGWGDGRAGQGDPDPAPTAFALLALMAAGEANSSESDAAVDWLLGAEALEPTYVLPALSQFERHGAGLMSRL